LTQLSLETTENILEKTSGLVVAATVELASQNQATISACNRFINQSVVQAVPSGFIHALAGFVAGRDAALAAELAALKSTLSASKSSEPSPRDIAVAIDFKSKLDDVVRLAKLAVQNAKSAFSNAASLVAKELARGSPEPEEEEGDAMDTDAPAPATEAAPPTAPAEQDKEDKQEEDEEDIKLLARSDSLMRTLLAQFHTGEIAQKLSELIASLVRPLRFRFVVSLALAYLTLLLTTPG
jgi:hypothetical protein